MKPFVIQQVLDFLKEDGQNVRYVGNTDTVIERMANIRAIENNSVSWIKKESFLTDEVKLSFRTHKDLLIVAPFEIENINTIVTENPKRTFFSILNKFFAVKRIEGIHPTATVETIKLGKNVAIGANCYIGPDVIIGNDVIIHHNVVIECPCTIGDGTEIFSGVVIGTEGFGYYYDEQHYMGVKIGRHVDIGANTCIDRGLLSDTTIEDNVKIDNHCQISHNSIIRENVLITGRCGVGGSSEIGKNSYMAPGSSVLNQTKIGENVFICSSSLVIRNVKDGKKVFGIPARSINFD